MTQWDKRARGLIAAAWLLIGSAAMAQGSTAGWEPMNQSAGREAVNTWSRPVEGMTVKAFRGVTEVPHNALSVLAVLSDTRALPAWVFQMESAQTPEGQPADRVYARFKGIWPASARDVLFRTSVSQGKDGVILVESRQVEGMPPQEGYVRMPYLNNVFRLTPLDGGWTRVEFETAIDLGGMVPGWLANAVSTRAPLVTLQKLHQQIKKPAYQIKSPAELPGHYGRGLIVLPERPLKAQTAAAR